METEYDAITFGVELQRHRKRMGWSAKQLSLLYSEEIGREDDPVSTQFIYQLEHGATIMDKGRRAILAQLVDMPLMLAGIGLLATNTTTTLFAHDPVDVKEYTSALQVYTATWGQGTTYKYAKSIKQRVNNLEYATLYAGNKKPLADLLCGYQILAADVVGEQDPQASALILNQTVNLAQQENISNLYVHALRQRAQVGISMYEQTGDKSALTQALQDFQATETVQQGVSGFYQGLVDVRKGLVYAYAARDAQEFTASIKILDAAGNQIGKQPEDSKVAARLDLERWRLNRASAYLFSSFGSPALALYELEQLEREQPNTSPRRAVHRNVLFSEVYLALDNYPMSIAYAQAALETTTSNHMDTLSHRIEGVYRVLRQSPYGNDPDTARFGVSVLKAQRPELF